jgi:glycosyltransferase involved in cell wall biosynthesis
VHSLNLGGAEMLAVGIAAELAPRFQSVFACLDDEGVLAGDLRRSGTMVHHLRRRGGIDWTCSRRLRAWLRHQQVDVIHAHQTTPLVYALLSGALTSRPPILFTEHGRFFPDRPGWKRRLIINQLLGPHDRIVAVGNAVRDALVRIETLPADRIQVIYNGVQPPVPHASGMRGKLRSKFGAAEDHVVLLVVARLDPIKNHALALRAMARLVRECPQARLWLVGDGPERARIEATIRAAGLGHHVSLLGEQRQIPELLAAADVALLTSHSEGIPLILIEAMASGVPVVATDVGGVSEVIEHDRQGWLVPAENEAALCERLKCLIRSPDERRRLGTAGRQRATQFSAQRMVGQYAALYEEMLAQR